MDTFEILESKTRVNLTDDGSEWVDMNSEVWRKIQDLLASQPNATDNINTIYDKAKDIQGANCHKTALYLRGVITRDDLFNHTNHDITLDSGHAQVHDPSQTKIFSPRVSVDRIFEEYVRKRKLPIRLTLFKEINPKGSSSQHFPMHSIVVVGISNKGQYVGFEKEGAYGDDKFGRINAKEIVYKYVRKGELVGIEA